VSFGNEARCATFSAIGSALIGERDSVELNTKSNGHGRPFEA
jgi:hypothetical protein